mmetsp:Transcript_6194/g.11464  ORF Transcript_6194/g.11464 Transcript_6194/m.11464 type:complete len:253 (+) Transcript_6194:509-1267(+)
MRWFPAIAFAPDYVTLYLTETLGTFFFVFGESLLVEATGKMENETLELNRILVIALGGGFIYYALLYLTMTFTEGHGCYLNPALTSSLIAIDLFLQVPVENEIVAGLVCIILQFCGGALGSLAARNCFPNPDFGAEKMGISQPNLGSSVGQMWTIELILSLVFALVVMSVRSNENRRSSFLIAFGYVASRLVAFPLTFSTLNPARSFAPVVSSGFTDGTQDIWVDLTAPIVGSALAAIVFYFLNHDTLRKNE